MPEQDKNQQIDELVSRIDAFMTKGGGRMNVTGGEGEATESYCHSCCGESADNACNMPVKE